MIFLKIIVLDGYTLNPGDLSWSGFEELGEFICYDRTLEDEVFERIKDADIIITNKTPIRKEILKKLTKCKYIGALATGYDVIDYDYAKDLNIIVTNVPTYGTTSVAQHVFALVLELCNNVKSHSDSVKNLKWANQSDFCFTNSQLIELSGKTIGIIGFGRIGYEVSKIAMAFNMKVIAYNRGKKKECDIKNLKWVELEELFKNSDIISLHCPLTKETEEIINIGNLRKMKKSAFLINTSRGKLINEEDLKLALEEKIISGAALDVLRVEPPKEYNPLYSLENCIITPHIAWATKEARIRLMQIAVENLKSFIDGKPINVVNS